MKYSEFKKIIESVEIVDKKIYDKLINEIGEKATCYLFEKYLNDPMIPDDLNKINRTNYYIGITDEKYDFDETNIFMKKNEIDIVKCYLHEIGNYPLLTQEEEIELAKQINESTNELAKESITIEKINDNLINLGYTSNVKFNNKEALENKKKFLINKINNINSNENNQLSKSELHMMNETVYMLDKYISHQNLVNSFMTSNLRLVVSIAKRYLGRGIDFIDLINEGNIGLKKGVEKFDIKKGCKFSTYATWWIRQAITRAIANDGKTISIPVHLVELINKVTQIENYLEKEYGKHPTDEEILEELKQRAIEKLDSKNIRATDEKISEICKITTVDKIQELRKYNNFVISLSTPVGEEEDSILSDFIEDTNICVEKTAIENESTMYIKKLFNSIDSKEKLVTILRKGLNIDKYMEKEEFFDVLNKWYTTLTQDELERLYNQLKVYGEPLTLEAIGRICGVTRERIRQIERKSQKKLERRAKRDKFTL